MDAGYPAQKFRLSHDGSQLPKSFGCTENAGTENGLIQGTASFFAQIVGHCWVAAFYSAYAPVTDVA